MIAIGLGEIMIKHVMKMDLYTLKNGSLDLTIFWTFLVVGVLEEWDYTGLTGQYWILQAAINTSISHHA